MLHRLLLSFAVLLGLVPGWLRADIHFNASEHGVLPGTQDAGPALRHLLAKAGRDAAESRDSCTIELEEGDYHFYAESSPRSNYFISNHDRQTDLPVGIPLSDKRDLTLRGNGARLIFHGLMQPISVVGCENVLLQDVSIRYATPFTSEGRIVEQKDSTTTLELQPDSSWCVEKGRFFNCGEGWKDKVGVAIAFLPDGRMLPSGKAGDIVWNARAEQLSPTRVRFGKDSRALGLSEGDTLVLRSYWRPTPALFIYRSSGTRLENVIIHDSMGMGILGQRSKDITIRGGGVIRRAGRYGTTGADATHFSNCRGHISVSGALFEGMMDDAVNVHATSLGITKVISPTEIEARYMHRQAYGFKVVKAGERVRFIHGRTLENDPMLCRVKSVQQPSPHTLIISLETPLPESISAGDALENADWHPAVSFCNNTVRYNRARGALFTTPEPVLVEHNDFLWSSGSAILLAGDAQGWYESGACRNVTIRHNLFDHCLTSLFQFTDAIISICPEVKQPEAQKERYHRNICIEHNRFLTHRVPLLSAISADGIIFRDNEIIYDEAAPPLFGGEPYRLRYCGDAELQPVAPPAP